MANSFNPTNKQLQITDAVAIDTYFPSSSVYVKSLRWTGASAGDDLVISNRDGKVLWQGKHEGGNVDVESVIEEWWNDNFSVAIDGGIAFLNFA